LIFVDPLLFESFIGIGFVGFSSDNGFVEDAA
jgi:hypothetical protein